MEIQKLPFEVVSASSSDDEYPPEQLLIQNHTPLAKGWISEKFCTFPQTLILHLAPGNCRFRKLQILSHHFNISTRLEFYIGRLTLSSTDKNNKSSRNDDSTDDMSKSARHHSHSAGSNLIADSEHISYLNDSRPSTANSDRGPISQTTNLILHEKQVNVTFTRLGYVTLGDNAKTNYKARELKSIHIDAEGEFLQIVCQRNHINPLNLYNQVGIVAINILGEVKDANYLLNALNDQTKTLYGIDPLIPDPEWPPAHDAQNANFWGTIHKPAVDKAGKGVKDLAFGIYHDEELASLMEAVVAAKDVAVQEEKYTTAKALKTLYILSKKAGEELAKLKQSKARAIENEDYEAAEEIRIDIEQIRLALKSKMNELGLHQTETGTIIVSKIHPNPEPTAPPIHEEETIDKPKTPAEFTTPKPVPTPIPTPAEPTRQPTPVQQNKSPKREITPTPPAPPPHSKNPPQNPFDDTPLPTLKNIFPIKEPVGATDEANEKGVVGVIDPEPLSDELTEEFQIAIEVYGNFVVRCLCSKQFKLREWALDEVTKRLDIWHRRGKELEDKDGKKRQKWGGPSRKSKKPGKKGRDHDSGDDISSGDEASGESVNSDMENETVFLGWKKEVAAKLVDKETFVTATFQMAKKGLNDTREKVISQSLAVWDQLTHVSIYYDIPVSLVFRFMDNMVPILLLKSSDMNPRIKQGCLDLLVTIANAYHKMPYSALKYLIKPLSTKPGAMVNIRSIRARLEAIHRVIKDFGVDDAKGREGNDSGLTVRSVMDFTEPQLHNKTSEARESAVKVVVELCLAAGEDAVAPFLSHIRPQLLEIIKDKISEAKGKAPRPRIKKRPAQPWKENPLVEEETGGEIVKRLTEEVEALKEMVEENGGVSALLEQVEAEKTKSSQDAKKKDKKKGPDSNNKAVAKSKPTPMKKTKTPVPPPHPSPSPPPRPESFTPSDDNEEKLPEESQEDINLNNASQDFDDIIAGFDHVCIFCDEKNPDFTEENLDAHYWKDCPVLCTCPLCKLIVEIPSLTTHMLTECDNRSIVRMCPRCKEAIMATELANHIARQTCLPASSIPGASRCALCHLDVPNGESGWKRHLLQGGGCPGNERKLKHKKKSDPLSPSSSSSSLIPSASVSASSSSSLTLNPLSQSQSSLQSSMSSLGPTKTAPAAEGLSKRGTGIVAGENSPGQKRGGLTKRSTTSMSHTATNSPTIATKKVSQMKPLQKPVKVTHVSNTSSNSNNSNNSNSKSKPTTAAAGTAKRGAAVKQPAGNRRAVSRLDS